MNIDNLNRPVAENIVFLINEKGLKQRAVAEKAGFTVQQFNDMLNGRRLIKICDLTNIAEALDVDANTLFRRTEAEG